MIEIQANSEAGQFLLGIPRRDNIYKVSIDIRSDGIAFKVNEGMWTATLMTTERVWDENTALKYNRC